MTRVRPLDAYRGVSARTARPSSASGQFVYSFEQFCELSLEPRDAILEVLLVDLVPRQRREVAV
jgi:hypothetical protein